jgi:hypothetical protein
MFPFTTGVELEVLKVRIEVFEASPDKNETVEGLKLYVHPEGRGIGYVKDKLTENGPVPPVRFTVTAYVALLEA